MTQNAPNARPQKSSSNYQTPITACRDLRVMNPAINSPAQSGAESARTSLYNSQHDRVATTGRLGR